jgi:hypothetical protein
MESQTDFLKRLCSESSPHSWNETEKKMLLKCYDVYERIWIRAWSDVKIMVNSTFFDRRPHGEGRLNKFFPRNSPKNPI